jgi:hypothetical protein
MSEYCIEVQRNAGESKAATKSRLMGALDDKYFNISTHLKQPERAGIRFVQRSIK